MVRKICDYAGAVAYEIGEDFRGKVQLNKIKNMVQKTGQKEFLDPVLNFQQKLVQNNSLKI